MLKYLKKLFCPKKPKVLLHPFFGELQFITFDDPSDGFWEGEMTTESNVLPINIAINASEAGPQIIHEQFWKKIISNFDTVLSKCCTIIEQHYNPWPDESFEQKFYEQLEWDGLTIPQDGNENSNWEISFSCKSDAEHVITVYFEKGKAFTVSVDG